MFPPEIWLKIRGWCKRQKENLSQLRLERALGWPVSLKPLPQEIWLLIHKKSDSFAQRQLERALRWPVIGIKKLQLQDYPDFGKVMTDHLERDRWGDTFIYLYLDKLTRRRYYGIAPYRYSYLLWHKNEATNKWECRGYNDAIYRGYLLMWYKETGTMRDYKILVEHCSASKAGITGSVLYYETFHDGEANMSLAEYQGPLDNMGEISLHRKMKKKKK